MKILKISKENKSLKGLITLPFSKSISNRILIIQGLSGLTIPFKNLSQADDTLLLRELLNKIDENKESEKEVQIDCKNAGTVFRFLTAVLSITNGKWILTGDQRMKERPIGILVEALKKLGAEIQYLENENFPPLKITGTNIKGGSIKVDAGISSQYISALLMIAPVLQNGLEIILENKISSLPYINMTLGLLKELGINYEFVNNKVTIQKQVFKSKEIIIESDWSSAAFWYELAALSDNAELVLEGLQKESLQGDSVLPEIYRYLGVDTSFDETGIRITKSGTPVKSFEYDFWPCPDLAQPVIATCSGLGIEGKFIGLESLQIKETDRLKALESELQKLGFNISVTSSSGQTPPFLHLAPLIPPSRGDNFELRTSNSKPETWNPKHINTYSDHRMAMAFAPLALVFGSIQIKDPEVVSKSYPGFWEDMKLIGFKLDILSVSN